MKVTFESRAYQVNRRTAMGNPIGWYVYINGIRYYCNVSTPVEAIKSVLKGTETSKMKIGFNQNLNPSQDKGMQ